MLAIFDVMSLWRATSTSRNRLSAPICGLSIMDIAAPAREAVVADLISHRPQAYSQKFGGPRTVSARGFQCHLDQLSFHIFERNPCPQTVIAFTLASAPP